jgi:short-subunit dehydrogenase
MKSLFNYKKSHCLVVGASSGLGLEVTKELLDRGAGVIAASRDTKCLLEIKKEYLSRGELHVFRVDITDSLQIDRLTKFSLKIFSNIDLLINTVGIVAYKPFLRLTDSEIKTVIDVNLTSAILLIKKILPLMIGSKGKKYIVQIGSLAGIKVGHANFSVYSASKEGLAGLFRSLVSEFKENRIKFILVCPTGIKTNIIKNAIGGKELAKKFLRSSLDSPRAVACGILDHLDNNLCDGGIRLLPTVKSKQAYEKL